MGRFETLYRCHEKPKIKNKIEQCPTKKQVEFVDAICECLEINKPKEYTKKAYSDFISTHKWHYYHNDYGNDFDDWDEPYPGFFMDYCGGGH